MVDRKLYVNLNLIIRYYADTARCQLQSREVNERLVFDGVLKASLGIYIFNSNFFFFKILS